MFSLFLDPAEPSTARSWLHEKLCWCRPWKSASSQQLRIWFLFCSVLFVHGLC